MDYTALTGLTNGEGKRFEKGAIVHDSDFPAAVIAHWRRTGRLDPPLMEEVEAQPKEPEAGAKPRRARKATG